MRRADKDGNEFDLKRIVCPVCGPQGEEFVGLRGGRYHRHRAGITTTIVRCRRCGLYFPNPFPYPVSPQTLYGDPDKYFENFDTSGRIKRDSRVVAQAQSFLGRPPTSLLDVGSGRGEMLAAARQAGIPRVIGLELSTAMVDKAKAEHGVEVRAELIEDYAASKPAKFDMVVLNAVLEHVYDPDSMIRACTEVLADDGVLYIDIPNEDHLLARTATAFSRLRRRPDAFVLSPTFPPYHVFGFTPRSLWVLLSKYGLAIEQIKVHGDNWVRAQGGLKDRLAAGLGTAVNVAANLSGNGHNMFAWARFDDSIAPSANPGGAS